MRLTLSCLLGATLLSLSPAATHAAELIGHHATYDLTFASSKDNSITAGTGTMDYEVRDACDGWATNQRLEMTVTNADGQKIALDSTYVTWESTDGHQLRFHMKQTTDSAVTSETEGTATTKEGKDSGGDVHYTLPKDNSITLPAGTLLPMAHTAALIEAARAGKKFMGVPLFDGTDEEGAQDTAITVQDFKPAGEEGGKWPELLKVPSTHVHIAFFDRKPDASTPEYEVGMRYWDNGVGDDMDMDFGNFVMHGVMKTFAPLPRGC